MTRSSLLTTGAMCSFAAAVLVVVFGVIATPGVYGSRMAWLLGVALPLLVLTLLLARVPDRSAVRTQGGPPPSTKRSGRGRGAAAVTVVTLVLLGIPCVFAGTLLSAYALTFIAHGIGLLR